MTTPCTRCLKPSTMMRDGSCVWCLSDARAAKSTLAGEDRVAAIDRAVTAELRALCVLDSAGVAVSVSQCMDCKRPYAAHLVAGFSDGARVALSHGLCDDCNEDRAFAEIDKRKARKAYDAHTWEQPE